MAIPSQNLSGHTTPKRSSSLNDEQRPNQIPHVTTVDSSMNETSTDITSVSRAHRYPAAFGYANNGEEPSEVTYPTTISNTGRQWAVAWSSADHYAASMAPPPSGPPPGAPDTSIPMEEAYVTDTLQLPTTAAYSQYSPGERRSSACVFSRSILRAQRLQYFSRSRQNTVAEPDSVAPGDEIEMQLSRHKLKATSRTSALLAGFAMVALVELDLQNTAVGGSGKVPHSVLIIFAIVTTLLVSVHLLALMMSTCMLPHIEALGTSVQNSPHHRLRYYIEMSWFFSTCLGLILFLLEIGIVFWIKFTEVDYTPAAYVATAILLPVFLLFLLFTYHFYRKLMAHHVVRLRTKLEQMRVEGEELRKFTFDEGPATDAVHIA